MPPAPQPAKLRILIVDDHPIVRRGLAEVIRQQPDMVVVADCDSIGGALAAVPEARPDVAIVDLALGLESGLELVKNLDRAHPEVKVLVLSMHDEVLHAERALAAGARGYIMKQEAPQNLLGAIRRVAGGQTYVSTVVAGRIVDRLTSGGAAARKQEPLERLTDREREVFALVGQGLSTREIAERCHLSVKTIETYLARIKEKLGLHGSTELVRTAVAWREP